MDEERHHQFRKMGRPSKPCREDRQTQTDRYCRLEKGSSVGVWELGCGIELWKGKRNMASLKKILKHFFNHDRGCVAFPLFGHRHIDWRDRQGRFSHLHVFKELRIPFLLIKMLMHCWPYFIAYISGKVVLLLPNTGALLRGSTGSRLPQQVPVPWAALYPKLVRGHMNWSLG